MGEIVQPPDIPSFTPQEEDFLRHYSESMVRVEAMIAAGLAGESARQVGSVAYLEAMGKAGGIITRAEELSAPVIASAMGADVLYALHHLKRICESELLHEAVKGVGLLLKVHGLTDPRRGTRRAKAIFLGPAQPRPEPKRVGGLGFAAFAPPDVENEG